jgi:hypothetical protein
VGTEYDLVRKLLGYGPFGVAAGAFLVILVRFGPQWLASLREKRMAHAMARDQDRRAAQARFEAKDAQLHLILTNHIAHLQAETEATRAFHQAATEHLVALTHEIRELRIDQAEALRKVDEIRGDIKEIKGRVS